MAFGAYGYGGYPAPGGYYPPPPVPDNLAQLRAGQYQQPMPQVAQPLQNQSQQIIAPVQPQPQATQAQPTILGPYYVSGDAGARGFLVGANNTVLLFDADQDANVFWLKSADANGVPSMRTFDYTERISVSKAVNGPLSPNETSNIQYATKQEFDALKDRVDALADVPSTPSPAKPKKTVKEEKEDA